MLTGQDGIKTIYFRDKEWILYEIINFITIFQSFIKILVVFIRKWYNESIKRNSKNSYNFEEYKQDELIANMLNKFGK